MAGATVGATKPRRDGRPIFGAIREGDSRMPQARNSKKVSSRPTVLALAIAMLLGAIASTAAPAAAAGLTVSPTSVAFGNVVFGVTGATSVAKSVKITNPTTGLPVVGLSIKITGADAAEFTITNNGCASTLAPGTSCTVMLTFTPSALGTRSSSLAVSDSASGNAGSAALSGVGVVGRLTITPLTLPFGNVVAGATSAARIATLKNPNTVALHINTVVPSGEFAITSDTCSGRDLAPSATCGAGVVFSPAQTGALSGNLTITDDAAGSPQLVALSGTGILANPTFSALSLSFGKVPVGTVSQPKTLTITNPNVLTLDITSIVVASPFQKVADSCGSSISAGGSCSVSVTFNPTTPSNPSGTTETAKLTVTDDGKTAAQTVSLSGVAFAAALHFYTLSPGAQLPTGAQCMQMVPPSSFEPRPENATANQTIPSASDLSSFYAQPVFASGGAPATDFAHVDGNYAATTDMILRWGACKWGIDEDLLRAQAAAESNWTQSRQGDLRTDPSLCRRGSWNGWNGSYCYQSWGIFQVKVYDSNAWPEARDSTSFNIDLRGAYQRACMNGDISYLKDLTPSSGYPTYPNGTTSQMLWGCIGEWFSGAWYDSDAIAYINRVRTIRANKPWLGWQSGPTSAVSITSPASGAMVSGVVPVSVSVDSSVQWIDFYVDGAFKASSPPYTYGWDSTNFVLNGAHNISVDAYSPSETIVGHAFVNVVVSN